MKKRWISLVLTLAMVLGLIPGTALAVDAENSAATATVSFTAQAEGAFLCAPQMDVEVSGDLAESYGYTDSIESSEGVSALDVLVKAHEIMFDDAFTSETATEFLVVPSTGYISKLFGTETTANGFILNGGYPNDDTESSYGGYNGTTVSTQKVVTGDEVDFFLYQDTSYWSDELSWFCQNGSAVNFITAKPSSELNLTLKSSSFMSGYLYKDADAIHAAGSVVSDAQLAWVDIDSGTTAAIDNAVTAESGSATLTMPETEGTYYLTAYHTAENIKNGSSPLIMSLTKVVVTNDVPDVDPCALTALSVANFDSNPKALSMTPVFSSDVTAYAIDTLPYDTTITGKFLYVKATSANENANIKASINGVAKDITSDDPWALLMGAINPGDNTLTITVTNGDNSKTYTVSIPMATPAPVISTQPENQQISLNSSCTLTVAATVPRGGSLSYQWEKKDGDSWTAIEGATEASYTASAAAYGSVSYRCQVSTTVSDTVYTTTSDVATVSCIPDAQITIPSDASLLVSQKDYSAYNYRPFTKLEPVTSEKQSNGTTTYYFNIDNGKTCNYRVSDEHYITYAGTFKKTADYKLTVTQADLQPTGKTKTTVDHNVKSNNGQNIGDIYLNINPQGYLKLENSASTYQLVPLRNWQAINGWMSNYFIEPDYHYTVLNEAGQIDNSVVSVSDSGLITAKQNGTAIVLVTYDAIQIPSADGGPFFGAIWPENTGVFVVSVGAEDADISTGMTINEGKNNAEVKLAGDALDAELDVIYFVGEQGSYTFTPATSGCSISVANPTVSDKITFTGFESVAANNNGSVTAPLTEGRNIVKLEKDGKAEYQIITAKKLTYTINNGDAVHPGDTVSITLDTIYHPANKLAGIYNMTAGTIYTTPDDKLIGSISGGSAGVYTIASNPDSQTVSHYLERSESQSWGATSVNYTKKDVLTIPEDYDSDTFTLTGGVVAAVGNPWCSSYGQHRQVTLEKGQPSAANSLPKEAMFGQLPDIQIPITVTDAALSSISLTTDNVQTAYYEGDSFNPENLVVTAHYEDGKTQKVSNYTISPEVLTTDTKEVTITYQGKTAVIPVSVTQPVLTGISVTTQPTKTTYTEGNTFDPTGMVVTASYNNNTTKVITDYSYEPNRTLQTSDTAITVKYGEFTATVPITVSVASSGGSTSKNISVSFTLLGDSAHGTPTAATGTHTLKANNLTTWIAKTTVSVPQNSKVVDVIAKALGLAGIPYENPTGNYITSVRGIGEFTNGNNSGWMYTLNNRYPDKGVQEQSVSNGDVIVFHYTDDYTQESTSWSSGGSSSGSSSTDTKVTAVISKIAAIGTVTKDSGDAIEAARKAYDALTDAQKKQVTNYAVLTQAETAYAQLTNGNKTGFTDVASNLYYTDAVKWAVDKSITNGTSATTFSPDASCTRAQIVTFLWRAAGSPAPKSKTNPFTDVDEKAYYADAVLWAVENGITSGTSDTTFSPDMVCTRSQSVTFMYRAAKATVAAGNRFVDVPTNAYYASAVQWAVEKGVTSGTGNDRFSPNNNCTRGQIVTFLYRANQNK